MQQNTFDVACLCAAWCHLCGDYEPVFDQVSAEFARDRLTLRRHWIDIEDDAELVGDFEVETFPTLVIADAEQVRFAGPLEPQPQTLRRLLRATLVDVRADTHWPAAAPDALAFMARLRRRSGSA